MNKRSLIIQDDSICRKILLIRDGRCQKCGATKKLVVSHCFGKKTYPNLRHDLNNLLLLCNDCHIGWWHKYPTQAWTQFRHRWPDRFDYLMQAKNKIIKLNEEHYKNKRDELKAELKQLEEK